MKRYCASWVSPFWSIENVNTFDGCVINQFEKDIVFKVVRCITRLTFKADHDFLADNFKTCEAWLKKKLKVTLVDKNTLKECNEILKDEIF